MFGVGMSELVVILLVALVFLGPDQLPRAARTLAKWMGTFKRYSEDLRLNVMGDDSEVGVNQQDPAESFKNKFLKEHIVQRESCLSREKILKPEKAKASVVKEEHNG